LVRYEIVKLSAAARLQLIRTDLDEALHIVGPNEKCRT
jgi:hypothetical protein